MTNQSKHSLRGSVEPAQRILKLTRVRINARLTSNKFFSVAARSTQAAKQAPLAAHSPLVRLRVVCSARASAARRGALAALCRQSRAAAA